MKKFSLAEKSAGKRSYLFRLAFNMITSWILPTVIICLIFYQYTAGILRNDTADRNDGILTGASAAFERGLVSLKADTFAWTNSSSAYHAYTSKGETGLYQTRVILDELTQIAYAHDSVRDLWLYLEPIDFFATLDGSFDVDFFFNSALYAETDDLSGSLDNIKPLLMPGPFFTPLPSAIQFHSTYDQKESALLISSTLRSRSGEARGFLTYLIDPASFLTAFDVYDLPEGTIMTISNAEQVLISSEPTLLKTPTLSGSRSGGIVEVLGQSYLYNCYTSSAFGFQYSLLYPYQHLTRQLQQLMLLCFSICACVIAVGSGYAYVSSRRLYRPIRNTLDLLTPDLLTPEHGTDEFEYINSQLADVLLKNHELESEFITALDVMQQSVVARLLRGEIDPAQAQEITAKYHIHLPLNSLSVMIVSPKREGAAVDAGLARLLDSCDYSFVLNSGASKVVIMNAMDPVMPVFTETETGEAIAIAASNPVSDLAQLPEAYAQAQFHSRHMLLNDQFEYLDEPCIRKRMLASSYETNFVPFEHLLINAVESRNMDKALRILDERFAVWFSPDLPLRTIEEYAGRMDALCTRCAHLLKTDKRVLPPLREDEKNNPVSAYENIAIRRQRMTMLLSRAGEKQMDAEERQMQRVLSYIDDNLSQDLSLESVTDSLGISYHALSRYLKQRFGMTFLEYVTQQRMERARKYLLETSMTVDEISRQIGYLSTASFIRNFNKCEGVSPGQYRKIKSRGADTNHVPENH